MVAARADHRGRAVQRVREAAGQRQGRRSGGVRPAHHRQAEGAGERQDGGHRQPGGARGLAERLSKYGSSTPRPIESTLFRDILSWVHPGAGVLRRLDVRHAPHGGEAGRLGGFMAIGKSKAKIYVETETRVTFADVAGVDEAKEELQEIVAFLKDPKEYGRLGARVPQGRAAGRPARAPARRCSRARSPAKRACRSSRSAARSSSRCSSASAPRACATSSSRRGRRRRAIIFIDELDALGRARGAVRHRRPRREGADAEPAAGRARRLRSRARHGAARRDQPARDPRPGAAARRPLRPPGAGRPARQARAASQILEVHIEEGEARRRDVDLETDRRADARLHRRRSRQPGQRGRAARDAARRRGA